MNLLDIRKLYSLLGHEGFYSRVGALDCQTKNYKEDYIKGLEALYEWCRTWNGTRNIFMSRAPTDSSRAFLPSRVCTFDLDPIRTPGEAATNEQHNQAILAGHRIMERFPGCYLASSGNGCLLIYPFDDFVPSVDYYDKEGLFIDEVLQPLVSEFNVKVDKTNYEKAIIKVIGTQSTKGDNQLHRLSRIISKSEQLFTPKIWNNIQNISSTKNELRSKIRFQGNPVTRIKEAQECLNKLGKEYYDDYEKWTKTGMALKEFGLSGFRMWKEWSKQGTTYKEGECEKKWETFSEIPEITLGSLIAWSRKNDNTTVSISRNDYFTGLFQKDSKSQQPITTGISRLDTCLRILPRGEITTIAARSGFGKTSFACTIAESLRKSGRKVLYFSTEMSYEYIMHKFTSIATNIPLEKFIKKDFTKEDIDKIRKYEREIKENKIIICDEFSPKIELVKDLVEQYKPEILIFDHITQAGTHWEYIAQFARDLKTLTLNTGIVTLLASQLNEPPRSNNGEVGPSIRGDIRGSQEIIFLSAIFMVMNNLYDVKGDIQPVELEICKNRFGLSGIKLEIHVNKQTGKFQ